MPVVLPRLPVRGRRLLAGGLLALGLGSGLRGEDPIVIPPNPTPVCLGFSAALFARVNENDARAAVAAMTDRTTAELKMPPSPLPRIYTSVEAVRQALANRTCDFVGLTLPEFWMIRADFRYTDLCVGAFADTIHETYVLLTHRDSPCDSLAALAGKKLALNIQSRTALALPWLDVTLLHAGLPDSAGHFAVITESTKPNKPVLDVYFRRVDACLLPQRLLATILELNPAMARSLRIVATSPPLVPTISFFTDATPAYKRGLVSRSISRLHETPAGRQILTILRMERVIPTTLAELQPSLDLLDEHARLCPAATARRNERLQHQSLPSANTE